jgi:hypothetical protein
MLPMRRTGQAAWRPSFSEKNRVEAGRQGELDRPPRRPKVLDTVLSKVLKTLRSRHDITSEQLAARGVTKNGLWLFFFVEGVYKQQGRAHSRRPHLDWAARPALMGRRPTPSKAKPSILAVVHWLLDIVYCLLAIGYWLLFIVYCLLFVVCCLLFIVYCLLSIVYCLFSIVYWLLSPPRGFQ